MDKVEHDMEQSKTISQDSLSKISKSGEEKLDENSQKWGVEIQFEYYVGNRKVNIEGYLKIKGGDSDAVIQDALQRLICNLYLKCTKDLSNNST